MLKSIKIIQDVLKRSIELQNFILKKEHPYRKTTLLKIIRGQAKMLREQCKTAMHRYKIKSRICISVQYQKMDTKNVREL